MTSRSDSAPTADDVERIRVQRRTLTVVVVSQVLGGAGLAAGVLVDKLGRTPMSVAAGVTLLLAGAVGMAAPGESLGLLIVALALLGLGWNFGVISGTALVVDGLRSKLSRMSHLSYRLHLLPQHLRLQASLTASRYKTSQQPTLTHQRTLLPPLSQVRLRPTRAPEYCFQLLVITSDATGISNEACARRGGD